MQSVETSCNFTFSVVPYKANTESEIDADIIKNEVKIAEQCRVEMLCINAYCRCCGCWDVQMTPNLVWRGRWGDNTYPYCCKSLTIETGKNLCFTEFSTKSRWNQGWLPLTFFICLHNQLNSFNSIIVQMSEKRGSSNRQ